MAIPWEKIATSDQFRNDNPMNQFKVKQAWLQQVAPSLYGADITTDFRKKFALMNYMQSVELGPKAVDEDAIVRPEALSMTGLSTVEANPAFERKSYEEQQGLRRVWFAKMAASDPEYAGLSQEQQMDFYKSTMQRAPALINKTGMPGMAKGQTQRPLVSTGFYDIEATTEEMLSRDKGAQQAEAYVRSSGYSFAESVAGWIGGPIRWLADKVAGEHNPLSSIFEDLDKVKNWQLSISEANNPIPELVAGFAGFLVPGGLFGKLEKGLAGGWKTVNVMGKTLPAISTSGKLMRDAGLLEKIGSKFKVGQRIPSAMYQIAGGTMAGALVGIGMNMIEGEDPASSLPQDIALGVGLESVFRFWGARSLMKKYLKSLQSGGYTGKMKDLFDKPLDVLGGQSLDMDFARTFFAHPIGKHLKQISEQATKNGFPLEDYYKPETVRLRASAIDLTLEEAPDAIRIKKGNTLLQTIKSDNEEVRWGQTSEYLDQRDADWEKVVLGKPFEEQAQLLPGVKMVHGVPLSPKSKEVILNEINKKNLEIVGANFKLDPNGDETKVTSIFNAIMKNDTRKATQVLDRLGVRLRADIDVGDTAISLMKKKEAIVASVRADLERTLPETDFFFINTRSQKVLKREELPQVIYEDPNSVTVSIQNGTYTASMDNVRRTLLDLKKVSTSAKSRVTRIAKQNRVSITRDMDYRNIQLQVEVPNADGVFHPVTLNFQSEQKALNFMRGHNKQEVMNIFNDDPEILESFTQFKKGFRRTNPKEFNSNFLPYQYIAKEAQQKAFFLGNFKGKYILKDKLAREGLKWSEFNTLYEVSQFLKKQDLGEAMPDITGIAQDAIEKMHPGGIDHPFVDKDPMRTLRERPLKEVKFNALRRISMFIKPTQIMMDDFNRMAFAKELRVAGMDPTAMYNSLVRGTMADHTWMTERLSFLQKEFKGVKELEEKAITDYMEARYVRKEENGMIFEAKADVEADMVQKFGATRAAELIGKSVKLRKMLEQVFSEAKLDPAMYLDNYMPHLFSEARMQATNMSGNLNLKEMITWLPKTNRKEFMEFFREVDIDEAILERKASRLVETYIRAASRKMFITPTLDVIKNTINKVSKEHWKTIKPTEAIAFIDYMKNIFRDIYGSKTASEIVTTRAGAETITRLARVFKKDITISKLGLIDKMTTLASLSYLGLRPYSVLKQLVSIVTIGGPYIGMPWMLEGINQLATPGQLERLIKAGVVSSVLPTGAEFITEAQGYLKGAAKVAKASMAPFKWGDDVARAAVYLGMEARLASNMRAFRSETINEAQFFTDSGMNLFGLGQYDYGKKLLDTNKGVNGDMAFVDHFSKLAADRTMFLYDRFQRPQLVRSAAGRFLGQFGTWPLNFLALLKDRMSTDSLTIPQKIKVVAELSAATWAVAEGFKAIGVNDKSLYPWNQVTFQGGPFYTMMNDMLQAIGGNQQAYVKVTKTITGLVPYAREGTAFFQAIDYMKQGDMWKAFLSFCSAPIQLEPYMQKADLPLLGEVQDALETGGKLLYGTMSELEN
jgi:hypothetical protein